MEARKLTAIKETNEREIEMMVGKAMCAYANARETFDKSYTDPEFRHVSQDEIVAALTAEYEATIRCIAMFVREDLYEIQRFVKAEAEKMMAA